MSIDRQPLASVTPALFGVLLFYYTVIGNYLSYHVTKLMPALADDLELSLMTR